MNRQPTLPAVPEKPRRVMKQPRKAWYRQRYAEALERIETLEAENQLLRKARWWAGFFTRRTP